MPRPLTRLSDPQHRALADFLRTHRERLAPGGGGRRRTPGLRREEIAQLSGISATWYTWMEQGRDVSVSPTVLDRLANALQLTTAERAYLFELAGKRDPRAPAPNSAAAPAALRAAVAAVRAPAYVLDGLWNAVAWNKAAARLFVGWLTGEHDRNLLRYIFTASAARRLIGDWDDRARRVLAEFRADYGKRVDDPAMAKLVEELRQKNKFFAEAWDEHMVVSREGGERTFHHPIDGTHSYLQSTFNYAPRPDFKLVILTPAKS